MVVVDDSRSKFGAYRVFSSLGSVAIDYNGPPKRCYVEVCEGGRRSKISVSDFMMGQVYDALGKFSPAQQKEPTR